MNYVWTYINVVGCGTGWIPDAIESSADGLAAGFVYWSRWIGIESRTCWYVGIFGHDPSFPL